MHLYIWKKNLQVWPLAGLSVGFQVPRAKGKKVQSPGTRANLPAMVKLTDWKSREAAEIVDLVGDSDALERLMELGLHQGALVKRVGSTPFSGPLIFQTTSGVIALRRKEAECIRVKKKG